MSFLFGSPADIEINLDDVANRPKVTVTHAKNRTEELPRYIGNEDVKGSVCIKPKDGKRIEHLGIKIELIGQIELYYDRGNHYDFTSLQYDLSPAGIIASSEVSFPFEFLGAEKQYESYNGANVRLRYFLRATVMRGGFSSNIVKEQDIWVINYEKAPTMNNTIKMEVGIEDCLHIEFEYNKSKYHLKDVIIGKVFFLLVRIRIKYMELSLIKRETTGQPPNTYNESETLTKFEIMDGAPVKSESIPVRLFLGQFYLTPTYRNVHSKFSVKYFLNLVLVDEEDRRYFKQQEVTLWRRPPARHAKALAAAAAAAEPKAIVPTMSISATAPKKLTPMVMGAEKKKEGAEGTGGEGDKEKGEKKAEDKE